MKDKSNVEHIERECVNAKKLAKEIQEKYSSESGKLKAIIREQQGNVTVLDLVKSMFLFLLCFVVVVVELSFDFPGILCCNVARISQYIMVLWYFYVTSKAHKKERKKERAVETWTLIVTRVCQ